jgi:ubiquinone/menaquinone biosynthesis C-methylase UbiE
MTEGARDAWAAGDAYEAYMGRWSRSLAREFLHWLSLDPGAHWLEVGCGTGALTSAICELARPVSVVACDPSRAFVEHARSHSPEASTAYVVAAADALPTREGGFDVVVSGLALNFFPEPERALAAMRERLAPGGIVAAYVWDYAVLLG